MKTIQITFIHVNGADIHKRTIQQWHSPHIFSFHRHHCKRNQFLLIILIIVPVYQLKGVFNAQQNNLFDLKTEPWTKWIHYVEHKVIGCCILQYSMFKSQWITLYGQFFGLKARRLGPLPNVQSSLQMAPNDQDKTSHRGLRF